MPRKYSTIDREQLEEKMRQELPDHESRGSGWALVNVLGEDAFAEEHIPGSINIPAEEVGELERRFAKDKEIVVYCASPECKASPKAAEALTELGFEEVKDYEGGMRDWKSADREVAAGHP